jgi:2-amino-4-hydroxy-6-hydroxymethyldihydropteridine diphosphokinase
MMGEIVYLSLGSNLGNRESYLTRATERLSRMVGIKLLSQSSLYHSRPLDCPDDCPDFLNMVLKLECTLKPVQLLDNTERLEIEFGRRDKNARANRVIDIDIVLFGDRIFKNERLEIPHPRMIERAFVLIPMREIDPDIIDPRTNLKFSDMLSKLGDQGVKIVKAAHIE